MLPHVHGNALEDAESAVFSLPGAPGDQLKKRGWQTCLPRQAMAVWSSAAKKASLAAFSEHDVMARKRALRS